jgi:hypothetical protein
MNRAFHVSFCAALLTLTACPKKKDEAAPDAGTVAAAAPDAAAPLPCKAEVAQFVIDKGARLDTGLTLTKLHDGRIALGYATWDGTPKAAIVDSNGKAQLVDVDAKHVHDSEKKESPKTNRAVNRVTPLGLKGMHMRVGVDLVDHNPDGSRYVRCGAADEEPTVSFKAISHYDPWDGGTIPSNKIGDGPNEVRDCRTFSNGELNWVLASELWDDPESDDFESRWAIDTKPGKAAIDDATVDSHVIKPGKDKKLPQKVDHYSYEVPVSVHVPGAGYVLAARYQGALVVAKRQSSLEPSGKPVTFNLGAPVGMAAMAVHGSDVTLLVTEAGKSELFGTTFAAQATPGKPEKLTLTDPNPPAEGDRSSTSVAATSTGDLYVVFADGKAGHKVGRLVVLGANLKPKTDVFDFARTEHAVGETRVAVLPDGRAFVATLEAADGGAFAVTGAVYSCKY